MGFATTEAEVQSYAKLTRTQAVNQLLGETSRVARTPAPAWVGEVSSQQNVKSTHLMYRPRLLR